MKILIALAASLAVNLAVLGTLEWSAYQAQTPPSGEVTITETADQADLLAYTQTPAPDQPDLLAYKRGRAAQLLL